MPDHDDIRAALGRGDLLVAYDLAMRGADATSDDLTVRHLAVLALARSGATERARRLLVSFGLDGPLPPGTPPDVVEDVGALRARLAKDRALAATGEERRRLARAAAAAYESTYAVVGGPFAGVNAATMWRLAGDVDRSRAIAGAVSRALDSSSPASASAAYWDDASRAEACLLLGDIDGAARALHAAMAHAPDAGARATTRRQLALVASTVGAPDDLLDLLPLPRVVHYTGHLATRFAPAEEPRVRDDVARLLAERDVSSGYGALASGADLIVAEELLRRGAEVHAVLPCDADDFCRVSVAPAGDAWVRRFEACLARADSLTCVTEGPYLGSPALFAHGAAVAMGKARLRASFLGTEAEQIACWDGAGAATAAGTAVDVERWRDAGGRTHVVRLPRSGAEAGGPAARTEPGDTGVERPIRAFLFADVQGFGRLAEQQVPAFVECVLGALARALEPFDGSIVFRNTWGDGLYVVFDDVAPAAHAALALRDSLRDSDVRAAQLPPTLALRIGAHAGPVLEAVDPVTGRTGFFGAEVTRAARIEPGTPPGEVYVTDPFAALLALAGDGAVSCQYVGPVSTAKGYGTLPLYALLRAAC